MATHNPKEARESAEKTLNYIYRGEGHEHSVQPGDVVHVGGNLFSPSPLRGADVDLKQMVAEFESQARINKNSRKPFKHYVLSIAPGETLNESQWAEFATNYMETLGFDNTTKWTAAIHRDTTRNQQHTGHVHYDEKKGKYYAHDINDGGLIEVTGSEHLHIMACLVHNELGGPLVSTSNDYQKGWDVMRKFERKFGLRELQNPDENFGYNYSKGQLKSYGSREATQAKDEAAIIRARFKNLYETEGRLRTITDLVVGLAKRDVHVSVSADSDNNPIGISYKAGERGNWISGSKVKATRFTWNKLVSKISYIPQRDNPILGLTTGPATFTMSVKITKTQFKRLKHKHAPFRTRSIDNEAWVDFTFCRSQRERDLLKLMIAIMQILKMLFGVDETSLELKRLHEEASMRRYLERLDAVQEAQEHYYEPTHLIEYDTVDTCQTMVEVEQDTRAWREGPKIGGGGWEEGGDLAP